MSSRLVQMSDRASASFRSFEICDDFDHFVTGDTWTVTATDSGGANMQDAKGGVLRLDASDGTVADNDEVYLHTTNDLFIWDATHPTVGSVLLQWDEANTPDGNVFVGLSSAAIANTLQDNGGGPPADYYGLAFFTVDGNANWQCEVSSGTTQDTRELTADLSLDGVAHVAGSSAQQLLEWEVTPSGNGSYIDVAFRLDGTVVRKVKDFTIGTPAAMKIVIGAKNGSANEETLDLDRVVAAQSRDK